MSDIKRFVYAQAGDYETGFAEISSGRKRSHRIWYIFPQIGGLGYSEMTGRYAIKDLPEATDYLADSVLGDKIIINKVLFGGNPLDRRGFVYVTNL